MNRRIRPAILFARLGALAVSLGIAGWLVVAAQRGARATRTATPTKLSTGPSTDRARLVQLPGALHGSKSMVLDLPGTATPEGRMFAPPTTYVLAPFLFSSKSAPIEPAPPPQDLLRFLSKSLHLSLQSEPPPPAVKQPQFLPSSKSGTVSAPPPLPEPNPKRKWFATRIVAVMPKRVISHA